MRALFSLQFIDFKYFTGTVFYIRKLYNNIINRSLPLSTLWFNLLWSVEYLIVSEQVGGAKKYFTDKGQPHMASVSCHCYLSSDWWTEAYVPSVIRTTTDCSDWDLNPIILSTNSKCNKCDVAHIFRFSKIMRSVLLMFLFCFCWKAISPGFVVGSSSSHFKLVWKAETHWDVYNLISMYAGQYWMSALPLHNEYWIHSLIHIEPFS